MRRNISWKKKRLSREFPGLDQVPGFDQVTEIKVNRINLGVLLEKGKEHWYWGGHDSTLPSVMFYVAYGDSIKKLDGDIQYQSPNCYSRALPNAAQIDSLDLSGPPRFVLRCHNEGDGLIIWTIYKTDKFDWEEFFRCINPETETEEESGQFV